MSDTVDYRTFSLRGNHYQIGYELGQLSPQFTVPAWWAEPPDLDFATACARQIALFHAPLLDEIQGYADGQGQPYSDFLRVMCRQRMTGRIPERGGCTSFAWRASHGHVLVGRNYDFHPVQRIRQRIHIAPNDGYASIGMRGSVPVGRYDGVNSAGLFACLHVVISNAPQEYQPGIPFHLIPRLVLETCATVKEAVDLLMHIPHLHSFNYLVADCEGFAVVEAHQERVRLIRPTGNVIAVGNFYQHPHMESLQGKRIQKISRQRVEFLTELARQSHESSWEVTMNAMRDRTAPVCGTEGGHTTLWSCVVDLTERRLAYAAGSPLEVEFEDVQWL